MCVECQRCFCCCLLFDAARRLTCIIQQGQEGHAGCNLPDDGLDLRSDLFVRLFWSLPAQDDQSAGSINNKQAVAALSPSIHNSLVCQEIKGPSLKNLSCLQS